MNVEQVALPIIRAIGARPRLSKQLFRFARWGDPYAPERFSWPYPIYDKMTADGPVVYSRPYQQWFVSGHDEVLAVLRSPNASTEALARRMLSLSPYTKLTPTAVENFRNWLLVTDPPRHTRLRVAVSRTFTPKRIEAQRPRIEAIADRLLDDLGSGRVDRTGRSMSFPGSPQRCRSTRSLPSSGSRRNGGSGFAPRRRRSAGCSKRWRRSIPRA